MTVNRVRIVRQLRGAIGVMWGSTMSDTITPQEFHQRMQDAMGLSDEDYEEFRKIMQRRLEGHPHEHTRFCGHIEVHDE